MQGRAQSRAQGRAGSQWVSRPPGARARRADLAHNTSGFVIPVFSANVHEIRAYNRLASLAKGRVVVVLQVGLRSSWDGAWGKGRGR